MPPVITPNFKSTPNFTTPPLCQSCQLAWFKLHVPNVNQPTQDQHEQAEALSQDGFEPDYFVYADQYIVNTPGRLILGYDKDSPHNQFHGGTIFHYAATSLIWAENQVSLGIGETLIAKNALNNG